MRFPRTVCLAMAALLMAGVSSVEGQRTPEPRARAEARPPIGWLGISFDAIGEGGEMAVVRRVYPGSPAARGGVQEGDTIVMWNGQRDVDAAVDARRLVPGDTVRLRLRRSGGRDREVALTAARRPVYASIDRRGGDDVIVLRPGEIERGLRFYADSLPVRMDSLHRRLRVLLQDSLGPQLRMLERDLPRIWIEGPGSAQILGTRGVAGAELSELNEGLASYFGTDRGVLVLRVGTGTPAARAGIQAGDVIVEAGDEPVRSIAELRRAFVRSRERDSREVELEVIRKGKRQEIDLKWE